MRKAPPDPPGLIDIITLIDGAIEDATSPDAMRWTHEPVPVDDSDEPSYCGNCQHFHWTDVPCPEQYVPCGSYLCCIND